MKVFELLIPLVVHDGTNHASRLLVSERLVPMARGRTVYEIVLWWFGRCSEGECCAGGVFDDLSIPATSVIENTVHLGLLRTG